MADGPVQDQVLKKSEENQACNARQNPEQDRVVKPDPAEQIRRQEIADRLFHFVDLLCKPA